MFLEGLECNCFVQNDTIGCIASPTLTGVEYFFNTFKHVHCPDEKMTYEIDLSSLIRQSPTLVHGSYWDKLT